MAAAARTGEHGGAPPATEEEYKRERAVLPPEPALAREFHRGSGVGLLVVGAGRGPGAGRVVGSMGASVFANSRRRGFASWGVSVAACRCCPVCRGRRRQGDKRQCQAGSECPWENTMSLIANSRLLKCFKIIIIYPGSWNEIKYLKSSIFFNTSNQ